MVQPKAAAYVVYRPIGVDIAAPPEPLRTMLDRRQRRGFEQKAAKETKGLWIGFL
jgi:hypothetical protein